MNTTQIRDTSETNAPEISPNSTPPALASGVRIFQMGRDSSVFEIFSQNLRFAAEYISAKGAIEFLSNDHLYPNSPVDRQTAAISQGVLAFLEWLKYPAPRIFSHSGDAVVFRWDNKGDRLYVTITDEEAAIRTIKQDEKNSNVMYVDLEGGRDLRKLQMALGDDQWKVTSTNP